ncbi:hypothetical protein H8959_013212, partial [Pygathrix nigripes]
TEDAYKQGLLVGDRQGLRILNTEGWLVCATVESADRQTPPVPRIPKVSRPGPSTRRPQNHCEGPCCAVRPPDTLSHPTVPLLTLERSASSRSPFTYQGELGRSSRASVPLFPARSASPHADREQPHSTAHRIQIRPLPLANPERAVSPAPGGGTLGGAGYVEGFLRSRPAARRNGQRCEVSSPSRNGAKESTNRAGRVLSYPSSLRKQQQQQEGKQTNPPDT